MKTLKFAPNLVPLVLSGEKTSTWRLFDDKDLQIGDELTFVNRETLKEFAKAILTGVREKRLGDITENDETVEKHEHLGTSQERMETFRNIYGDKVTADAMVKMLKFALTHVL
ncbi:MAG: ASCH domain-containing protein [Patescibacteria group bacterium]|jgi:hypothetical protein